MKTLVEKFFELSDSAHVSYDMSEILFKKKQFQEAKEELAHCNSLRNRMRLIAWNSPKIQALVKEQSGQEVEPDECLLK